MNLLAGVIRYEFRMSIMRRSMLIIFLLFTIFTLLALNSDVEFRASELDRALIQQEAGQAAFAMNIFFPVIAGIITADRAVRDDKLAVRELLRTTRLSDATYVIGKYLGVALSILALQWGMVLITSVVRGFIYGKPLAFLLPALGASALINFPGLLFVIAFSLACPLVLPLRVYQVLFTGYWYWGNFLSPEVIPSISNTYLHAAGRFALSAFYFNMWGASVDTSDVVINILVLMICAALALTAMWAWLQWRGGRWERNA